MYKCRATVLQALATLSLGSRIVGSGHSTMPSSVCGCLSLHFIGELGVEHGRLKSARLSDPRFARYYAAHRSINFLDEIERSYLRKLVAGQISLDDFFDAMKDYINAHNSGSQGSRRESEAEHIVHHILAQLVQNLRLGRREKEKSPKTEADAERRRRYAEGPSALESAVRDVTKTDGGEER